MPEARLWRPAGDAETDPSPSTDPLGATEERLASEWIRSAVESAAVSFGAPTVATTEGGALVHCTLLGVTPLTAARASRETEPLRLMARYLVTASAATRAEADRVIVSLAFAAMKTGRPELEREGPAPELWTALGIAARPALLVREPVEQPREARVVPLVREVVTGWSRARTVAGRVLGPGDLPIAGARLDVAGHDLTTHSDHRGDFSLAGVPTGPPEPALTVTARGIRMTVRLDPATSEPLLIRLPLPEK